MFVSMKTRNISEVCRVTLQTLNMPTKKTTIHETSVLLAQLYKEINGSSFVDIDLCYSNKSYKDHKGNTRKQKRNLCCNAF